MDGLLAKKDLADYQYEYQQLRREEKAMKKRDEEKLKKFYSSYNAKKKYSTSSQEGEDYRTLSHTPELINMTEEEYERVKNNPEFFPSLPKSEDKPFLMVAQVDDAPRKISMPKKAESMEEAFPSLPKGDGNPFAMTGPTKHHYVANSVKTVLANEQKSVHDQVRSLSAVQNQDVDDEDEGFGGVIIKKQVKQNKKNKKR
jgi:hypothetical protein